MEDKNENRFPEWVQKQLRVHLKKKELASSEEEKLHYLKKRKRSRWWMLAINIAAILFFGFSFYFGITQLSDTFLYILLAVFVLNVGLIFYQTKQLTALIDYLEKKLSTIPNEKK